jgi:hypothetical protein
MTLAAWPYRPPRGLPETAAAQLRSLRQIDDRGRIANPKVAAERIAR